MLIIFITAVGNTTMCAEFNFHIDPEAAHIVLSELSTKITLLPWETCLKTKIPFVSDAFPHFISSVNPGEVS